MARKASRDLTGQTFGSWTVIERSDRSANRRVYWVCRCACDSVHHVAAFTLINGASTRCRACHVREIAPSGGKARLKDLTGGTFGKWTVLRLSHVNKRGQAYWVVVCDCLAIRAVDGYSLRRGTSTQCRSCAHTKTTEEGDGDDGPADLGGRAAVDGVHRGGGVHRHEAPHDGEGEEHGGGAGSGAPVDA